MCTCAIAKWLYCPLCQTLGPMARRDEPMAICAYRSLASTLDSLWALKVVMSWAQLSYHIQWCGRAFLLTFHLAKWCQTYGLSCDRVNLPKILCHTIRQCGLRGL